MLRLNSEKVFFLFLILSLDMVMQAKIISRVSSRSFSLKIEYPKIHPRYDWHDFQWIAYPEVHTKIRMNFVIFENHRETPEFIQNTVFVLIQSSSQIESLNWPSNENHANHIKGEFSDIQYPEKDSLNSLYL